MSHKSQPMSIEAMLDMERREVLALLENRPMPKSVSSNSPSRMRSASPYTTPRSPVRSMLDIGGGPARTGFPGQGPIRSMLDPDTPLTKASGTNTTPSSPVTLTSSRSRELSDTAHIRSFSDASQKPVDFGPRSSASRDPTADYQFAGILTHNAGQQLPKRNTQGGKRQSTGALAEALRTGDLSGLQIPSERGRRSFGGRLGLLLVMRINNWIQALNLCRRMPNSV